MTDLEKQLKEVGIRSFKIDRYINPNDYFESEEYNKVWEGFQKPSYKHEVDEAFVVLTDPKDNYGMEFDLYYIVTTKGEGLRILHKESTIGCLCSTPFAIAFIDPLNNKLNIGPHVYSREQKSRDYFAKLDIMVTTL